MTLDKGNTDKLSEFRNEARRLGIRVEPPSLRSSGVDFDVHEAEDGTLSIRYALSAVKGVGEGQAHAIVEARRQKPFRDMADFAARINPRDVNKRVLESLCAAGAFDEMEPERARAFATLEAVLAIANRTQAERAGGQDSLFGGAMGEPEKIAIPKVPAWPAAERLRREFDAVGFFLSGHPLDDYQNVLQKLRVERWAEFARAVKKGASAARLAATVLDRTERRTKSGNKMGIVTLSDQTGQYEAILFQEGLNQYRDLLEKGAVVLVGLQANVEGEDVRARIVSVEPLEQAAQRVQKGLRIFLRDESPMASLAARLGSRGDGEVSFVLMLDQERGEVEVKLPGRYQVSSQVAGAIKAIPGVVTVEHT
jgi:DNA polymerase-3 subunit alpha